MEKLKSRIFTEMNNMRFQGTGECWSSFKEQIPILGCIAESYILDVTYTPSFQGFVEVSGEVFGLSTHEQIMGGLDNQVYLGCMFPSQESYRKRIQDMGICIGTELAQRGVRDHFSVDFVAVKTEKDFDLYALEINLRKGGTTHTYMTLKLLCDGYYNQLTGEYLSKKTNKPKYYIASDNICHQNYKGFLPHDIMEMFSTSPLHYSPITETGTVFHLLGALSQFGKIGVTCIGDSSEEAKEIFEKTISLLDKFAEETQNLISAYTLPTFSSF